jgi:hypothetical protein
VVEGAVTVHCKRPWLWSAGLALIGLSCAEAPPPAPSGGAPQLVARALAYDPPPGSDAVPTWSLAFEHADGSRSAIAERATAYVRFRDGVALTTPERRLLLISPDGSRRLLAASVSSSPARGPSGELLYVALYGAVAELHRLTVTGEDRVIARELSSAGLLAPHADGSVLLVGAPNGGVAGIWRVDPGASQARCITNCELRTGQDWKGRFVPPPGTVEELEAAYRATLAIDSGDGVLRSAP